MKLARLVWTVPFVLFASATLAAAEGAFELLQDKRFDRAVSALEDSLRRDSGDPAAAQRWRLAALVARLAHKEERVQQAAFAEVRALSDPAGLVRVDWSSGIQLWSLALLAADALPAPDSRAVTEFEAACRGPGPTGEAAGSVLCGVALALEAAGYRAPARRAFAAGIARCGPDAALVSAACAVDLSLFADSPWGTTPLERAQTTAVQAILAAHPGSFPSVIARFAVEDNVKGGSRIALPQQYRTSRISLEMNAFPRLKDTYFRVIGGRVCVPKGRFALLPGCDAGDGSRLGTLLLPFEPKGAPTSSPATLNPAARVRRAGDLLARALLMRRGFHIGGTTIEESRVGASTMERVLLAGWKTLPKGLCPPCDEIKESGAGDLIEDVSNLDMKVPTSPESLLVSNPWLYGLLGKELTKAIDRTLGDEIYSNPRVPYLDWGAREAEFGVGLAPFGVNSTRAWEVSEFWRAANIKKYAALNAVARNDQSLSETERTLIRRQMTLWWEQIVADYRQHVSEDALDLMTGDEPATVAAQIDTINAREHELAAIRGRAQQISDNHELREKRKPFITSGIALARECQASELPGLLPPGTLFVTISTSEKSTAVMATLIADATTPPEFVGQLHGGLGRLRLMEQLDPLLAALAKSDSPEEQLMEMGGSLFDALFSDPRVLERFDRCERIVFAPNGPAGDIPFAMLVRRHGGQPTYLGLESPISVTESAALLRYLVATTGESKRAGADGRLIAGDPTAHPFTDPFTRAEVKLPRPSLPEAEKEARDIGTIYEAAALTGALATESDLRGRAENSALIHIASHGYTPLDPRIRAPLAAGVWTTATCDSSYGCDGMLQAWEFVTEMSLKSDLVVFSGCSTGRLWTSFGTVGELARSTLYAGARSVLVAQWNVGDAPTRTLMTALHRRLKGGVPRDRALKEAMAELRESGATRHPSNWAAFRCLGVGWQ